MSAARKWEYHNSANPCPICGDTGRWCSTSADGAVNVCRRSQSERADVKTDKNGAEFYVTRLKEGDWEPHEAPEPTWREQLADVDTRDQTYRALLAALPLSAGHLEKLRKRGLSGEAIERIGFATLPPDDFKRTQAVAAVKAQAGIAYLLGVPGFYKHNGNKEYHLTSTPGLLIPVRNADGKIVALRIRVDAPNDRGSKYRWFSSPEDSIGCGPGAHVHVPQAASLTNRVRVTEGEIKAEIATASTGVLTLSVPGVTLWPLVLPILKQLDAKTVCIAYDGDARRKKDVARALVRFAEALHGAGHEVEIEVWPEDAGKGIDDVLAAGRGKDIEVHRGREAWERISEIAASAGVRPHAGRFVHLSANDIFEPLPPIPWLVKDLDICPGFPTMINGYGFSKKTMAAQDLALAVASGQSVWGAFACRQGRVLHVDYEQGARLDRERYQRLARGRGIDPAALEGKLSLVVMPQLYLDSTGAEDAYAKELDGFDLVIIDSLRASAPGVDENSSEVRKLLDILGRVSERTGIVPLIIHHSRKPQRDASGGAKMAVRGSSGIFDACSSLFVFSAEKKQPTLVQHEKARTSGVTHDDFLLEVQDVVVGDDPKGGLRVVSRAPDQSKPDETRKRISAAILALVDGNPGCSMRVIRDEVTGKKATIDRVLEDLIEAGQIVDSGTEARRQFYIAGTEPKH